MGCEERELPVFKIGEDVVVFVAGLWYAGKVAMFDVDNPSICVELPRPFLPWPLGRLCYVRRDRPNQLWRGPMRVSDFTAHFLVNGECPLRLYEWGEYAVCWRELITSEHVRGMMASIRRDFVGDETAVLLRELSRRALAVDIDVSSEAA
jgi:hypothetical protein